MNIITATSWNGTSFTFNVEKNRWDMTDNVTIGEAHRADEGDLRVAREQAENDGALFLADSAMLVDFDELLRG